MRRVLTTHWPAVLLLVLAYPLLLMGLDRYSLVNGDEGIYHAVSVNMVNTGDWIRLYYRGEHIVYPTFINAPLQYCVTSLCQKPIVCKIDPFQLDPTIRRHRRSTLRAGRLS